MVISLSDNVGICCGAGVVTVGVGTAEGCMLALVASEVGVPVINTIDVGTSDLAGSVTSVFRVAELGVLASLLRVVQATHNNAWITRMSTTLSKNILSIILSGQVIYGVHKLQLAEDTVGNSMKPIAPLTKPCGDVLTHPVLPTYAGSIAKK